MSESRELVERLRNRPHDAPMESEHMMDDAADLIERQAAIIEDMAKQLQDAQPPYVEYTEGWSLWLERCGKLIRRARALKQ